MGCLIEFVVEIVLEGLLELIGYCYIKLMQLIVPQKAVSERTKETIHTTVTIVAVCLGIVLVIGAILLLQPNSSVKSVGRCMVYVSLTIIGLQIILGILVSIVSRFKK